MSQTQRGAGALTPHLCSQWSVEICIHQGEVSLLEDMCQCLKKQVWDGTSFCSLVSDLKVWASYYEISSKLDLQVTESVIHTNRPSAYEQRVLLPPSCVSPIMSGRVVQRLNESSSFNSLKVKADSPETSLRLWNSFWIPESTHKNRQGLDSEIKKQISNFCYKTGSKPHPMNLCTCAWVRAASQGASGWGLLCGRGRGSNRVSNEPAKGKCGIWQVLLESLHP